MVISRKVVLLVEDNPDDEALILRAWHQNNLSNTVLVARNGTEALDYLFATGAYAERDINDQLAGGSLRPALAAA